MQTPFDVVVEKEHFPVVLVGAGVSFSGKPEEFEQIQKMTAEEHLDFLREHKEALRCSVTITPKKGEPGESVCLVFSREDGRALICKLLAGLAGTGDMTALIALEAINMANALAMEPGQ